MIDFKLNGQPLKLASCWEDLTYGQLVAHLENKEGTAGIISILTGIPIETVRTAKIQGLDMIIQTLTFLNVPTKFDKVTFQAGDYKLPVNSKGEFDIQFESLSQFEDMRSIMAKTDDKDIMSYTKSLPRYVAIYLQAIRDGEYNHDRAVSMVKDEIYNMPAHQVIPLGSFFFVKLWSLLTGTQQVYPKASPNQKKMQPVSAVSKKHSDRSSQSSKSPKKSGKKSKRP